MTAPTGTDKYPAFGKIPRFHRDVSITEKIDGTNGLVAIDQKIFGEAAMSDAELAAEHPNVLTVVLGDDLDETGLPDTEYWVSAGSRTRWLRPGDQDNAGFRDWVKANARTLVRDLGPGLHFGEWYGQGIQRNYGLNEKRFALFNTDRWSLDKSLSFETPALRVVPLLWDGPADNMNNAIESCLEELRLRGSLMESFPRAEGIVIFHSAAQQYFKVTLEKDEVPKAIAEQRAAAKARRRAA